MEQDLIVQELLARIAWARFEKARRTRSTRFTVRPPVRPLPVPVRAALRPVAEVR